MNFHRDSCTHYIPLQLPSGNLTYLLKMAIYSEFSPLNMVIFHSYVKLPEGNEGNYPQMTLIQVSEIL